MADPPRSLRIVVQVWYNSGAQNPETPTAAGLQPMTRAILRR